MGHYAELYAEEGNYYGFKQNTWISYSEIALYNKMWIDTCFFDKNNVACHRPEVLVFRYINGLAWSSSLDTNKTSRAFDKNGVSWRESSMFISNGSQRPALQQYQTL